jgi:hypothetical protein
MRTDRQVEEGLRAEIARKETVEPVAPFAYSVQAFCMNSRFETDFQRIFLSPHLASDEESR